MPHKPMTFERWKVVGAFLFVLVLAVVGVYFVSSAAHQAQSAAKQAEAVAASNRRAIRQLSRDKASISQLERSNCRVRQFLLNSVHFRLRIAMGETGARRRADLRAARTSQRLADAEANERCPVSSE